MPSPLVLVISVELVSTFRISTSTFGITAFCWSVTRPDTEADSDWPTMQEGVSAASSNNAAHGFQRRIRRRRRVKVVGTGKFLLIVRVFPPQQPFVSDGQQKFVMTHSDICIRGL